MLLGELVTVAMYRLPVKIVVFNNSTLGMVKLEMLVDGLPDFGVDVAPVDYSAVASALGIFARRIEDPADIESGLRQAFDHDGPALVDLVTDRWHCHCRRPSRAGRSPVSRWRCRRW